MFGGPDNIETTVVPVQFTVVSEETFCLGTLSTNITVGGILKAKDVLLPSTVPAMTLAILNDPVTEETAEARVAKLLLISLSEFAPFSFDVSTIIEVVMLLLVF